MALSRIPVLTHSDVIGSVAFVLLTVQAVRRQEESALTPQFGIHNTSKKILEHGQHSPRGATGREGCACTNQ